MDEPKLFNSDQYVRILYSDGVRTVFYENRFELLVKPGDTVSAEDPLLSLESDKATMEVPSPQAGTVKELKVKVGDKVSKGSLILTLDAQAADAGVDAAQIVEASVVGRDRGEVLLPVEIGRAHV